jgi:CRP-like cAMP-binding protein
LTGTDTRVRKLAAVPLFARVTPEAMARIAALATEFEAPTGLLLIEANEPGAGMFVIEEGSVLVSTRTGRYELGPGDVVGELALFTAAGIRTARVQTQTPVRCLALRREDFCQLLLDEPRVAVALLEVLAERLAAEVSGSR